MPIQITESPKFEVLRDSFRPSITDGGTCTIDQQASRKAFNALHAAQRRGCYIFAIEYYGVTTPWYVGKATQGFGQEILTDRNCKIYAEALDLVKKGKPKLYFVALPNGAGAPNVRAIDKLENMLIEDCGMQNPRILNKRKIAVYKQIIIGVMNAGQGRSSGSAAIVKKMTGRS